VETVRVCFSRGRTLTEEKKKKQSKGGRWVVLILASIREGGESSGRKRSSGKSGEGYCPEERGRSTARRRAYNVFQTKREGLSF